MLSPMRCFSLRRLIGPVVAGGFIWVPPSLRTSAVHSHRNRHLFQIWVHLFCLQSHSQHPSQGLSCLARKAGIPYNIACDRDTAFHSTRGWGVSQDDGIHWLYYIQNATGCHPVMGSAAGGPAQRQDCEDRVPASRTRYTH